MEIHCGQPSVRTKNTCVQKTIYWSTQGQPKDEALTYGAFTTVVIERSYFFDVITYYRTIIRSNVKQCHHQAILALNTKA
ncbi:MAG: hypothetical protein ACI9NY_000861 [Kiritimatiellia bacterium]|jgi:hypothetical protein